MKRHRFLAAAVALLSLAACAPPASPGQSAPSSKAADPQALLAASTAGLVAGNYRYTTAMPGLKIDSVVHLPSQSRAETMVVDDGADHRVIDTMTIGQDRYNRDSAHRGWQHFDLSRMPAGRSGSLAENPDPTGATKLLPAVRSATLSGSTITGVLDGGLVGYGAIALAGVQSWVARTYSLSFTAKLDDQGRLVHLVLNLPASKQPKLAAGTWTLDIDKYGAVSPPRSPEKFTEAPEDTYQTP